MQSIISMVCSLRSTQIFLIESLTLWKSRLLFFAVKWTMREYSIVTPYLIIFDVNDFLSTSSHVCIFSSRNSLSPCITKGICIDFLSWLFKHFVICLRRFYDNSHVSYPHSHLNEWRQLMQWWLPLVFDLFAQNILNKLFTAK